MMKESKVDKLSVSTARSLSAGHNSVASASSIRVANLTLYALVLFIACAIVWASVSEIDSVVTARGKLISRSPNISVQPLETSIVRSMHVEAGQIVRKGDVLITLDPTFTEADVAQLKQRSANFAETIGRLRAESEGWPFPGSSKLYTSSSLQVSIYRKRNAEYQARISSMNGRLEKVSSSITANKNLQAILARRLKVAAEIEDMRQGLYQAKHGSKLYALGARAERLQIAQDLSNAEGKGSELIHEKRSIIDDQKAFVEEWRRQSVEELAKITQSREELIEQLHKAQKRNALVELRAPVDAVVLDVSEVGIGSVVKSAEPLISIAPLGAELQAEIEIGTSDIGQIKVGDMTRLKLDTFPFQRHGTIEGEIRTISRDSFTRDGREGQVSYFVAHTKLKSMGLRNIPKDFALYPGMSLECEIIVGKRTVMSYLFYPLFRMFDEGLRET